MFLRQATKNGLSRRRQADEDINDEEETSEEVEDWIDRGLGHEIWVLRGVKEGRATFEEV